MGRAKIKKGSLVTKKKPKIKIKIKNKRAFLGSKIGEGGGNGKIRFRAAFGGQWGGGGSFLELFLPVQQVVFGGRVDIASGVLKWGFSWGPWSFWANGDVIIERRV